VDENPHPNEEHWQAFANLNEGLKVSLVFYKFFKGICTMVKHIAKVHMVKVLECGHIDETAFRTLMEYHGNTLDTLVFVHTGKPVDLKNTDELWNASYTCENIKNLTLMGYYVEDDDLLFVGQRYKSQLANLMVTRKHIVTFSDSCSYYVKLSPANMTHLERIMSQELGRPWKTLNKSPLGPLYFIDGEDDALYTNINPI